MLDRVLGPRPSACARGRSGRCGGMLGRHVHRRTPCVRHAHLRSSRALRGRRKIEEIRLGGNAPVKPRQREHRGGAAEVAASIWFDDRPSATLPCTMDLRRARRTVSLPRLMLKRGIVSSERFVDRPCERQSSLASPASPASPSLASPASPSVPESTTTGTRKLHAGDVSGDVTT